MSRQFTNEDNVMAVIWRKDETAMVTSLMLLDYLTNEQMADVMFMVENRIHSVVKVHPAIDGVSSTTNLSHSDVHNLLTTNLQLFEQIKQMNITEDISGKSFWVEDVEYVVWRF